MPSGHKSKKEFRVVNLAPGTIIEDRFQIISYIGEGGMGTVYTATQIGFDRTVALKFLDWKMTSENEEALARLEREAQALSRLQHKNIVTVYGLHRSASHGPFLAMEFLAGQSLQQLLSNRKPLTTERSVEIAIQICEALMCAHSHHIVHRDIKPSNIILGEQYGLKVIDFGLIKLLPEYGRTLQQLTEAGCAIGSVLYMSPEQCTGSACDERSDIYAVGCVLHHCLTGAPPFEGDHSVAVMHRQLHDAAPLLSDVCPERSYPEKLQDVLNKAMAKAPDDRYKDAAALMEDLKLIAAGKSELVHAVGVRLSPMTGGDARWRSSQATSPRMLLGSLLCLVLVLAMFIAGIASGVISGRQYDGIRIPLLELELAITDCLYKNTSTFAVDNELALAQCLSRSGRTDRAVSVYTKTLSEFVSLLENGEISDSDQRIFAAAKGLQQLSPQAADEIMLPLSAKLSERHTASAEALLNAVIKDGPSNLKNLAKVQLGSLQCKSQDATRATETFDNVMSHTMDGEQRKRVAYIAGTALYHNHHYRSAIDFLQRGVDCAGKQKWVIDDIEALRHIGLCHIELHEGRMAELCFERTWKALKEISDEPTLQIPVLRSLGETKYALGHYLEAEDVFRQEVSALKALPQANPIEIATISNRLGDSLVMQGKFSQAKEAFSEALVACRQVNSGPSQQQIEQESSLKLKQLSTHL